MSKLVIELSDGSCVGLKEIWVCAEDTTDAHSEIEVFDEDEGEYLGSYVGELPDTDDEDFSMEKLVSEVEEALRFI